MGKLQPDPPAVGLHLGHAAARDLLCTPAQRGRAPQDHAWLVLWRACHCRRLYPSAQSHSGTNDVWGLIIPGGPRPRPRPGRARGFGAGTPFAFSARGLDRRVHRQRRGQRCAPNCDTWRPIWCCLSGSLVACLLILEVVVFGIFLKPDDVLANVSRHGWYVISPTHGRPSVVLTGVKVGSPATPKAGIRPSRTMPWHDGPGSFASPSSVIPTCTAASLMSRRASPK